MKAAWPLLLLTFGSLLGLLGCGPNRPAASSDPNVLNLQALGAAYQRATITQNRPPANRDELMLAFEDDDAPPDILRSLNDGEEFVIVWGVELRKLKARGAEVPVVAFEKHGKNGKRAVLRGRNDVVLMTDSELKAAVFPPGYTPPL